MGGVMAYWSDSSVGFAPQSAFGTENTTPGDFVYLKAESPSVTFETETTELDLMTGQVGAAPERIIGRRSGSITMSMPLEGLRDSYDPTSEDPGDAGVLPYLHVLLGNAIGSYANNWVGGTHTAAEFWSGERHISCSSYTAGGVASATSAKVVYDNATASDKILGGAYLLTSLSATTSAVQSGFAKTKGPPDTAQTVALFENSTNTVNDPAANAYGTGTAWQSDDQPIPLTIRWKGNNAAFGYRLVDCICESFTINLNAAETPTVEFTFSFYNFIADKTIGGLVVPSTFQRIPTILGTSNGRVTIGGTATCGLEDVSIGWSAGDLRVIPCHSEDSGIASVQIVRPVITAAFSIPHKDTDPIYDAGGTPGNTGAHSWQYLLESGDTISIGVEVGSRIGRMWSALIPSAIVTASPVDAGELVRYQVQVEASSYSGDTSDTAETSANSPLDSIFRIGQG
jgi:hypothetical protein